MQSQAHANIVVIDCAPICGERSPPLSRIEYFGKTKEDIEEALRRAQKAYNARFKLRPVPGLGNKLMLVAFLGIAPIPLMFFGGLLINILATIGVPVSSSTS